MRGHARACRIVAVQGMHRRRRSSSSLGVPRARLAQGGRGAGERCEVLVRMPPSTTAASALVTPRPGPTPGPKTQQCDVRTTGWKEVPWHACTFGRAVCDTHVPPQVVPGAVCSPLGRRAMTTTRSLGSAPGWRLEAGGWRLRSNCDLTEATSATTSQPGKLPCFMRLTA